MNNQIKVNDAWVDLDDGVNPEIGQEYRIPVGNGGWQQQAFYPKSLSDIKVDAVAKINPEANLRISALDWKVTRASERKQRGRGNQSALDNVLDERENIRIASDTAIIAINALTTIEEVKNFTW